MQKELSFCIDLAKKASEEILQLYNKPLCEHQKSDGSVVTCADIRANRIIVDSIKQAFPNDGILCEEEKDNLERLQKERVWIVDPLDGTDQFLQRHGNNGQFTVNIALAINGLPVCGVVQAPLHGTTYYASKNSGTYKISNGKEKRIQTPKSNRKRVIAATNQKDELFEKIKAHTGCEEEMLLGSALKGCFVAEGTIDIYPRTYGAYEWDIAAMDIIVREAGAMIFDRKGEQLHYNNQNPKINEYFLAKKELVSICLEALQ